MMTRPRRLRRIALSLGADVPFFLDPQPSRVTGIGERIAAIAGVPRIPLVIAVPPFEVSTAAIFRALEPAGWSGAAPDEHLEAIVRGDIAIEHLVNDLAAVAIAQFPEIRRLKGLLEDSGALVAQMSGSGGAVFGLFDSTEAAESAALKIRKRAPFATVIATTTLESESEPDHHRDEAPPRSRARACGLVSDEAAHWVTIHSELNSPGRLRQRERCWVPFVFHGPRHAPTKVATSSRYAGVRIQN